ncbi:Acetyltransferase (GNAT) domain-containing protein [Dethiosulfatibacter aminovorans DSM 17477]|uniref:Acetyltransferase (GNAT) domain-containing protein n=1 Tax=Dethiosulfatibacter aminovorans DSM 17477 TaxID=1121476 RepID=A0A1M6ANA9_9FIRM|nr:GNAT family N-acetyltransferase [Dethiosulfatibacter aminovorans]SHI37994.1 Acetyltransferase (GNAT) domain-containing protein [Dethiosulfatibacter aminovorans DSM 17477]
MKKFEVVKKMPSIEDYLNIRKHTLGEKTRASAKLAIDNSWFGVHITIKDKTIGMGRMIGDGCTFHITDVTVLPQHQGLGFEGVIMEALVNYYRKNAPKDGCLTVIAKGEAKNLYKKFNFEETAPKSVGMKYNNML